MQDLSSSAAAALASRKSRSLPLYPLGARRTLIVLAFSHSYGQVSLSGL